MKKLKSLIYWAGIIIILTTVVVSRNLANMDEIWNFNIARCIADGLVPYKDISMVTTPLLGFFIAQFLSLFGKELFVYRIIELMSSMLIIVLSYIILKKLKISKVISRFVTIGILFLLINISALDYNILSLVIVLAIILLELVSINRNKNSIVTNIFTGLLAGFAICTKQNIGLIISTVVLFIPLLMKIEKGNFKLVIKYMAFRLIGILIPVSAFFIYLAVNSAFPDFINYAIKGISTFSNRINYVYLFRLGNIVVKVTAVIIPIVLLSAIGICVRLKVFNRIDKNMMLVTIYSLAFFLLIYPIADVKHFFIAIVPSIILAFYLLSYAYKRFLASKITLRYVFEFIETISILLIISTSLICFVIYNDTLGNLSKYKLVDHFNYITISDDIYLKIDSVDEYIKNSNKKVYILDYSGAYYMIPINRYNKNYDMFKLGNLGAGGEDAQIDNIKNEDARYLIRKDSEVENWQTLDKVRSYVKENMKFVGSIECFDIYENEVNGDLEHVNQSAPIDENVQVDEGAIVENGSVVTE